MLYPWPVTLVAMTHALRHMSFPFQTDARETREPYSLIPQ